jgi:hypothetical protein
MKDGGKDGGQNQPTFRLNLRSGTEANNSSSSFIVPAGTSKVNMSIERESALIPDLEESGKHSWKWINVTMIRATLLLDLYKRQFR